MKPSRPVNLKLKTLDTQAKRDVCKIRSLPASPLLDKTKCKIRSLVTQLGRGGEEGLATSHYFRATAETQLPPLTERTSGRGPGRPEVRENRCDLVVAEPHGPRIALDGNTPLSPFLILDSVCAILQLSDQSTLHRHVNFYERSI